MVKPFAGWEMGEYVRKKKEKKGNVKGKRKQKRKELVSDAQGALQFFTVQVLVLTSPRMLLSFATCTYSMQFLNVRHNN